MLEIFEMLSNHPEVLLFALVGVGAIVGHFSMRGISLGAAAVLFVAIAFSAWATSYDVELEIPIMIGHLGLALFTFSVGICRARRSSTR